MSQLFTLTKQLAASSANNICLSQTPTSGTALTLNGAAVAGGVATLDTQRRVLLTYGNEASPRTLAITGTNDAGTTISETLSVPSGAGGTIATQQDFKTVTSAVPAGGGWTAAITLGTNTTGSTPWFVPDYHMTRFSVGLGFEILSGSLTVNVEQTDDSLLMPLPIYQAGWSQALPIPNVVVVPAMSNLNAAAQAEVTRPCSGFRLTVTAGTGQGRLTIRQAGLSNH